MGGSQGASDVGGGSSGGEEFCGHGGQVLKFGVVEERQDQGSLSLSAKL